MNDAGPPKTPVAAPGVARTLQAELWILGALTIALYFVLRLKLVPALLSALLVFELINVLVPMLRMRGMGREVPRVIAVTLIAIGVIAVVSLAGVAIAAFIGNPESLPQLFRRMAQILETSRDRLPVWLLAYLPADAEQLRLAMVQWLRSNAGALQWAGTELGRGLAQVLIGMVIGALASFRAVGEVPARPVGRAIYEMLMGLGSAFRRVVFAQFWISTINTTLTAIYLALVLPLMGIELPLVKTMIVVTFVVGLIPILGNLISNTIIFIVSMSHSLYVAIGSLAYLVAIHKLEYFLNARIVGYHINARAWELLVAMLVMEAAFGIPGLIAAPIFYAFIKDQLQERQWL